MSVVFFCKWGGVRKSEQRAKNNIASFYLLLDEDQVILKF